MLPILSRSFASTANTVFALSSGAGRAGVAVVRISGPCALQALDALDAKRPKARMAALRTLKHPHSKVLLDHALVLRFDSPASFTGEDVVELHVHGGTAVTAAVLDALAAVPGLRFAEPGEFTRQAFMNGKLDLTQVEGLADLINAETQAQRTQALRHMGGEAGRLYGQWREQLVGAMAQVAAYIDFGEDEGIDSSEVTAALAKIRQLRASLVAHIDDARCGERVRNGVDVCIVGRPDVGKSSLLNILCRRPAAIVAAGPGTTRDILDVSLEIAGLPVVLRDTAGVRYGADVGAVEEEGVRRAVRAAQQADLRICVQDASACCWRVAEGGSECACGPGAPIIAAVNKIDLHPPPPPPSAAQPTGGHISSPSSAAASSSSPNMAPFSPDTTISPPFAAASSVPTPGPPLPRIVRVPVSCTRGDGLDELQRVLAVEVQTMCAGSTAAPAITRARVRVHVQAAIVAIDDALAQDDLVLVAEGFRRAAEELALVTGRVYVEDVLDVLFATFCIGK